MIDEKPKRVPGIKVNANGSRTLTVDQWIDERRMNGDLVNQWRIHDRMMVTSVAEARTKAAKQEHQHEDDQHDADDAAEAAVAVVAVRLPPIAAADAHQHDQHHQDEQHHSLLAD